MEIHEKLERQDLLQAIDEKAQCHELLLKDLKDLDYAGIRSVLLRLFLLTIVPCVLASNQFISKFDRLRADFGEYWFPERTIGQS